MFTLQSTLVPTPIPPLQSSCEKFLEWSEPLLDEQEFIHTQNIVAEFIRAGGEGEKLQARLAAQSNNTNKIHWDCATWLDLYLSARYPLVINSNVFYYLKSKLNRETFSQTQLASALIIAVYQFNRAIEDETLCVDKQKEQPLCMAQYKNLFSATRVPQKGKDTLRVHNGHKHIVVLFKGHLFKVNIADDNGLVYAFADIEAVLQEITQVTSEGQNIGIFTTLARDDWAEKHVDLLNVDDNNHKQMRIIEEALFTLSLDENQPEQTLDCSQMLWHGDAKNRYFDKALQFIVFKNGKMGINFEHAGMDGAVMLRLIRHLYDNITYPPKDNVNVTHTKPKALIFKLNRSLEKTLIDANKAFQQSVSDYQTRIIHFTKFGKNSIKNFNISPDAFIQIALQLAEYKMHGRCSSAYEAVMTRGFSQGRIDVLFTLSMESKAFVESMHDVKIDRQSKQALLRKAAQKHISRASECRQGMGIYTHLLALSNCVTDKDLGQPEIFNSKALKILTHNKICTSTTSDYGVELAGYGPIVADGYGIRYFNREECIDFNITSRTENQENLQRLLLSIQQSLSEMASLMA